MKVGPLSDPSEYSKYLELRRALVEDAPHLVLNALLRFTKTQTNQSPGETHELIRDFSLEKGVRQWMNSRIPFETLVRRFNSYDKNFTNHTFPNHYAVRFSKKSQTLGNLENVFLYFPFALGFSPTLVEEIYSIELIEVSLNIYRQIVIPCIRSTFKNCDEIINRLGDNDTLARTIFLYSLFHEVAHQVGPWRNSPAKNPQLKTKGLAYATLGEFSADLLLINVLREYPEVGLATLLIRLFWYTRGYAIQTDNDAQIGSYLWRKSVERGVIRLLSSGEPILDIKKVPDLYDAALKEITSLSQNESKVADWMQGNAPWRLPPLALRLLGQCLDHPTKLQRLL